MKLRVHREFLHLWTARAKRVGKSACWHIISRQVGTIISRLSTTGSGRLFVPTVVRGIFSPKIVRAFMTWQVGRRPPPLPFQSERSEEHTSELQSLMRISYAVFCLKKK